ncbi:hypothetical protein CPB86DRAFT_481232 [Serendipita vermifera]|nr:hypothetical protein CPB86DRAFT_481232 [Serendipita vermifera]
MSLLKKNLESHETKKYTISRCFLLYQRGSHRGRTKTTNRSLTERPPSPRKPSNNTGTDSNPASSSKSVTFIPETPRPSTRQRGGELFSSSYTCSSHLIRYSEKAREKYQFYRATNEN